MDPVASGFVLGLLFGAAKIGAIGTVGFAIAWWRSRARIRALETTLAAPAEATDRLAAVEQGLDYVGSQLDRLLEAHQELERRLPLREAPEETRRLQPPAERHITPR